MCKTRGRIQARCLAPVSGSAPDSLKLARFAAAGDHANLGARLGSARRGSLIAADDADPTDVLELQTWK